MRGKAEMDILILADFCGRFDGNGNNRFLYLAEKLSREHNVEILTSDFNHGTKSYFDKVLKEFSFKITMVHEGAYVRNVSLKRFYGHFIWSRSVKNYLKLRKKPDVVYAAVPPLAAAFEVSKYCEKNRIRFIIDIQDLWPEAFRMVFNVPFVSNLVFSPFKHRADEIYKRADVVCAVSDTYANRALWGNKKARKQVVFLGTSLETFDNNVVNNPVEKPENEIWIGYCGALGASYDIAVVIDALHILKEKGVNPPKFIIMGDGERRQEFEQKARELEVDCLFMGNLPYDQMCGWIAKCNLAANPIMHNAAQSIINKHGDYAGAGIPVINTQECKEYRNLVNDYHMGFNVANNDAEAFADKLRILIEDENLRISMGQNARCCAEERFDRRRTYTELVKIIEGEENVITVKPIHANRGFWNELFSAKWDSIVFKCSDNIVTDDITKKGKSLLWKLSQLNVLDLLGIYQTIKVNTEDDIILSYNRFICSNVPYVLVVENPTAMVHYHPKRAKSFLGKRKLKKTFAKENLKTIICLSDACKEGLFKYYQIPDHIKVKRIYPYVSVEDGGSLSRKSSGVLECLFVSSNFNLKGGSELVEAIIRNQWCDDSRIHFNIITKIEELDKEEKRKIKTCSSISLYDYNFSKSELKEFYEKANVFIHLTRMDSFSLVILEAMKHGCAIIATDLYAIGEMVENEYNGFLCEPTSKYWNEDKTLNEAITKADKAMLYSSMCDEVIIDFISEKLNYLLLNYSKMQEMGANSLKLARTKFASNKIISEWEEVFRDCLKERIK